MRIRLSAAALSLTILAAPLCAQTSPGFIVHPTLNQFSFVYPTGVFASLPANSFGGSGIPTNAVMTETQSIETCAMRPSLFPRQLTTLLAAESSFRPMKFTSSTTPGAAWHIATSRCSSGWARCEKNTNSPTS